MIKCRFFRFILTLFNLGIRAHFLRAAIALRRSSVRARCGQLMDDDHGDLLIEEVLRRDKTIGTRDGLEELSLWLLLETAASLGVIATLTVSDKIAFVTINGELREVSDHDQDRTHSLHRGP